MWPGKLFPLSKSKDQFFEIYLMLRNDDWVFEDGPLDYFATRWCGQRSPIAIIRAQSLSLWGAKNGG